MPKTLDIKVNNEIVSSRIFSKGSANKIILFCHGFPGTNRLDKLKTSLENQPLEFVEINYRGDKLSEGKFSFLGSIEDVTAVAKYLRAKNKSAKIYALGCSGGGFYVLHAEKENPGIFDKIILLNSLLNAEFLEKSNKMNQLWKVAEKILTLNSNKFYKIELKKVIKKHNPMKFAHEIKAEIKIVQSINDELFSTNVTRLFNSKLSKSSKIEWVQKKGHDLEGNERELVRELLE